jgi:hypothetical protein
MAVLYRSVIRVVLKIKNYYWASLNYNYQRDLLLMHKAFQNVPVTVTASKVRIATMTTGFVFGTSLCRQQVCIAWTKTEGPATYHFLS